MTLTETLTHEWQSQLQIDCPTLSSDDRDSIVRWLIGEDVLRLDNLDADQFVVASFYISLEESPVKVDNLDADQFVVAREAMNYRYRILMQRYLGVQPEHAYRQLIQRLSSLFLIRSKIRDWVALSHDRQRTVADVLQEVIQELMQSDSYMQQQIAWIAQCTSNPRLRNSLTLASIEEYCLRPIRNQPLLVYRFVNYLRRSQRGGMTEVPTSDLIRFVSEEDILDDTKDPVNFLDAQAIAEYQYQQSQEEEAYLYNQVRDEFSSYLAEEVDPLAASWFELYLQGLSQEEIVKSLKIPIKQVYRLREKVAYHVRNFTRRSNSESVQILVADNFRDSRKYLELGRTYFESGDYEKTINAYQEALEVYLFEEVPQKWAQIQRGLAETYSRRIQGDRSENLELAIQHYQRALEVFTRETFPQEWAATQVDLARFHFQRIRGDRSDNLEQAIAACESALQVFTRETFPESWAQTQFLLAKIYYERIRGDRSENLERAIAVCQLAFQVYIREAFPEGWTKVQTILATAYSEKIQGDRVENLEQAINNLLQALEDEDSYVRRRAVEALGQIGSEQAIPKLLQSLNDEVSGVRWRVVEALERIGSEQAVLGLLRSFYRMKTMMFDGEQLMR